MSPSDLELVKRYVSGNRESGRELYERYKNYVARIIRNMENEHDAAEDLFQQSFVKIFTSLHTFKQEASLKTWMTIITINTVRNHRKQRSRQSRCLTISTNENDDEDGPLTELSDNSENPGKYIMRREIKTIVQAGLSLLSDQHREVLILWNEGFTYQEIGEMTGAPPQTVGSRLHYARSQLKKLLTPYVRDGREPGKNSKPGKK